MPCFGRCRTPAGDWRGPGPDDIESTSSCVRRTGCDRLRVLNCSVRATWPAHSSTVSRLSASDSSRASSTRSTCSTQPVNLCSTAQTSSAVWRCRTLKRICATWTANCGRATSTSRASAARAGLVSLSWSAGRPTACAQLTTLSLRRKA